MGDTKLLPCPFCGGEPELYTIERHTHTGPASFMPDYGGGQFIECGCGIAMAIAPDKDAAAAWNTRPALLARQEGEDAERWRFFAAHFDKPMMREWIRRGFGLHPDAFTPSITAVVDAARSGGGG